MEEKSYVQASEIIQVSSFGEGLLIPLLQASSNRDGNFSGLQKVYVVAKDALPIAGAYAPVISGEVNGIVVNPNGDARFMRIGSNVIVFAQLEIIMDTGENTGSFEISLPVASDLTSQKDCFGMMQLTSQGITTSELDVVWISADITNNTCLVELETITTGVTLSYCTLQFTYQVQ
jgi:hypothetical protein